MSLTDKLVELDQYLWKQYEKVTNYCNKEFGWNKYDLVRKTDLCMAGSLLGNGTYLGLRGLIGDNPTEAIIGGIISLFAVSSYSISKKVVDSMETEETHLLMESGAAKKPYFKAHRPALLFGFSLLLTYYAVSSFTGQFKVPGELSLTQDEYNRLTGLVYTAAFFYTLFYVSNSYFQDQVMTPPSKKKPVLSTLYDKVMRKFQAAPVPQLEAKHQSIDDVVA